MSLIFITNLKNFYRFFIEKVEIKKKKKFVRTKTHFIVFYDQHFNRESC